MQCPRCGSMQSDGALFCEQCHGPLGANIPDGQISIFTEQKKEYEVATGELLRCRSNEPGRWGSMRCSRCKSIMGAGWRYCDQCGAPAGADSIPEGITELSHQGRVIIVLCVDCSKSMDGEPIKELNATLQQLEKDIRADEWKWDLEILVVGFGGNVHLYDGWSGIRVELSTVDAANSFVLGGEWKAPVLVAGGAAPIGAAVLTVLDLVAKRKALLYKHGVTTYEQPCVWLMTNGQQEGEGESFWMGVAVAERVWEGQEANVVSMLPWATANASIENLAKIARFGKPIQMRDYTWAAWLRTVLNTSLPSWKRL